MLLCESVNYKRPPAAEGRDGRERTGREPEAGAGARADARAPAEDEGGRTARADAPDCPRRVFFVKGRETGHERGAWRVSSLVAGFAGSRING